MADQTIPSIDTDHSKHAMETSETDQTDVAAQPPLKKSASNVPITLNIRYKNQTFRIECDLYDTLRDLKEKIDRLTDVDPQVQKLVNKSISSVKRDDTTTTLKDLQLTDGQTLLLVGATRAEIASTTAIKTNTGANRDSDDSASGAAKREPLSKQTRHEKVIKAGRPDNAQVGIKNLHDPLPSSIDGLLMSIANHAPKKARLTFKLELDELWINTAETTRKLPMKSIQNIVDEPIVGQEEYSIIGFQTGSTENSIIWIYWCPSQYVKSIRREILSDY